MEQTEVKPNLKLRPLKMQDVFAMSKILKKIELKIKVDEGASEQEAGAMLIVTILENLYKAEDEVNAFLGSLCGITAVEFANLDFTQSFEIIEQFKQMPGIANFFKLAMK